MRVKVGSWWVSRGDGMCRGTSTNGVRAPRDLVLKNWLHAGPASSVLVDNWALDLVFPLWTLQ
ncbi:hypothetical protein ACJ72_07329 [Emergomyces africanus]|uniref:Uncharacterized protein n=1 Tax=Emergomyces africanus TaxID=1955775 RepID=A0A1B7NNW8_9EURO|nr:hypothetical protein ACJ72_07329 [Emergomyces africanus]